MKSEELGEDVVVSVVRMKRYFAEPTVVERCEGYGAGDVEKDQRY